MPTINFQLSDLSKLTGKKITPEELSDLAHYFKGELGSYDKKTDEAAIELDDTNLPYLWSVEGMARLLRGVFKTEKGLAKIKVEKSKYDIIADESTNQIRPFIAAFVAKGRQLDDYLLKQLIQLQEMPSISQDHCLAIVLKEPAWLWTFPETGIKMTEPALPLPVTTQPLLGLRSMGYLSVTQLY